MRCASERAHTERDLQHTASKWDVMRMLAGVCDAMRRILDEKRISLAPNATLGVDVDGYFYAFVKCVMHGSY